MIKRLKTNKGITLIALVITIIVLLILAGVAISMLSGENGIAENAISIVRDGIELYMPLEGLVDLEEEAKRKQEEKAKLEFEIQRAEKMLSNPGFVNKAPQAKVDEEKAKLDKYKEMLEKLM